MDLNSLNKRTDVEWEIPRTGSMRVPGIIFASPKLIHSMDHKVYQQVSHIATLPGIIKASYAMPNASWRDGSPMGYVAAFDPDRGGVISADGVWRDLYCGARILHSGLKLQDIAKFKPLLADVLFRTIFAGVGREGRISLSMREMDDLLSGGAKWAVNAGFGCLEDLAFIEEQGCVAEADPSMLSERVKKSLRRELGTFGAGMQYLEIQHVTEIYNAYVARSYGIQEDDILISIHCDSREMAYHTGTDFLASMRLFREVSRIAFTDRALISAPVNSSVGAFYLGVMRSAINYAFANRQILSHLIRAVFERVFPDSNLTLLHDASHNTDRVEMHEVEGSEMSIFIHRNGAARVLGPGNIRIPASLRAVGQPVLLGGNMGATSYILCGTEASEERAFSSACCYRAGPCVSLNERGRKPVANIAVANASGEAVLVRTPSLCDVGDNQPSPFYRHVSEVVNATDLAGLARKVARLEPVVCIAG